jgi:hypothetical protein
MKRRAFIAALGGAAVWPISAGSAGRANAARRCATRGLYGNRLSRSGAYPARQIPSAAVDAAGQPPRHWKQISHVGYGSSPRSSLSRRRRSGGDQDRPGVLVRVTGLREQKQAKRYKQFLVTLSVIFPLTIFVPWVRQPLFQTMPLRS